MQISSQKSIQKTVKQPMFVKLQYLDTNHVHILNSVKTSTTNNIDGRVSLPLPHHRTERQPIKKDKHPPRKPSYDDKKDVFYKPRSKVDSLVENPDGEKVEIERKMGFEGRVWSRKENLVKRKLHNNRSKKCLRGKEVMKKHNNGSVKPVHPGEYIPAILEALRRTRDLDEAFKPWEEILSNKIRTIILKEQKSWERAMEIFEWFKRKGCELNVIHYNIMINILGKARRWSEVELLRAEMDSSGIAPENCTFGTLINVYSEGGLREKAMYWLEMMNEKEMEPDEVTMSIIVQMYKKARQFEKAEEFFKKWSVHKCVAEAVGNSTTSKVAALNGDSQAHVCLSSSTYNTLIDTYGKSGRLKDAYETFESMLREGSVPNAVTFNTMIHMFGNHGRLEEVAALLRKMKQLKCPPDTRTYTILSSIYEKHDNIRMAAECFRKIKEASLEPNAVSYRTLLYAFSIRHMVSETEELVDEMDKRGLAIDEFIQTSLTRMYIEAGMLEKSWLWFKRFHLEGNMSPECYSANIDAFGERGHVSEAEKIFSCCQEGRNPSLLEFNVMIKAYGINKRYEEACSLVDSMEAHGVFPDKCSYNSLIQMLASANLPEKAMFYVRKLQESGLVTDCIPFCAVISSFAKLGQLEKAVGVYEELISFNVEPDVVVYGVLINAFAEVGNVEEALKYVNAMKDKGLPMNAVICKSLIKLYTKVGWLAGAEEVYHMLQQLGMGSDVYSSNCMIDLYTERSMVEPAEVIFAKLRKSGIANEFSYAMMLCAYKKTARFEDAFEIAQTMREDGLLTDLLSYNHILGLYASDGRFKEAVALFKEMIESSVQPNDSTFKLLGVVLIKRGVSKRAVMELQLMWQKDYQGGLEAWMVTLNSMVGMVIHNFSDEGDEDLLSLQLHEFNC